MKTAVVLKCRIRYFSVKSHFFAGSSDSQQVNPIDITALAMPGNVELRKSIKKA